MFTYHLRLKNINWNSWFVVFFILRSRKISRHKLNASRQLKVKLCVFLSLQNTDNNYFFTLMDFLDSQVSNTSTDFLKNINNFHSFLFIFLQKFFITAAINAPIKYYFFFVMKFLFTKKITVVHSKFKFFFSSQFLTEIIIFLHNIFFSALP